MFHPFLAPCPERTTSTSPCHPHQARRRLPSAGAPAAGQPLRAGELDVALQRYDQLIALNPKAPIPYVNKRIVLIKYVNHYKQAKLDAEKSAEENKADKVVAADFTTKAGEAQAKIDALTPVLEQTTATLSEVQKAAKEAKDAGK